MALSQPGAGPLPSASIANVQRRERLRQLALETVDIKNDPYFMKNHLGKYECKLCLTLHTSAENYMAHTQGKRHQQNLGFRNARLQAQNRAAGVLMPQMEIKTQKPKKVVARIGRPGYKVVKQKASDSGQKSLLFQLQYPQIEEGLRPRYRFMSAFEQHVETPNDKFQFLLFAADPYETVAFKIPNMEIDKSEGKFLTHWDEDKFLFTLQLYFKADTMPTSSSSSKPKEGDDSAAGAREEEDMNPYLEV
jgi:splicing factor 3A subunit 2